MATIIKRSFAGGEISPSLYKRTDTVKYQTGLRTMRNMMAMRHGGAWNRPGSVFVAEVKDSSKKVRLIPFIFNSDQTYVLEFGDEYLRVHKNGQQLFESTAKVITGGVTQANPAVVTSAAHGLSNGEEVFINNVNGMTELNNRNFKVAGVTTNTFQLQDMQGTAIDSTNYGAYSGSGGDIFIVYEIASPYEEDDLMDLQFVQSADVITIVHPLWTPRELQRTGDTSWAFDMVSLDPSISPPTSPSSNGSIAFDGNRNSYVEYKLTSVNENGEESLPTSAFGAATTPGFPDEPDAEKDGGGEITTLGYELSWSSASGAVEYNIYRSRDRGAFQYVNSSPGTSFTDKGGASDPLITPPKERTLFASPGNYPSAVSYFQQRLTFANTLNNPETIWSSQSGRFKNFTTRIPTQPDDAITFNLAGREVNAVRHLIEIGGQPVVFTSAGEWSLQGGDGGVLAPGLINPKQHTYNGTGRLAPIVVDGSAIYVQAEGSIVRDLEFNFQTDGYKGNDLTIFSSHLFDKFQILDWTYSKTPNSTVWAVRDDGVLLGLTYIKEQQIVGWHRHDMTGGVVERVCSVPEGQESALYCVVKRTIDGVTKRYIERLSSRFFDDIKECIFMDSALSYDGRNTDTNEDVYIEFLGGDGGPFEDIQLTFTSSQFTADNSVGRFIHVFYDDDDGVEQVIRFEITEYGGPPVVTCRPNRQVPASFDTLSTNRWAFASSSVGGLWHLEGQSVSAIGDGFVIANPNNDAYEDVVVENGIAEFPSSYTVIHVGLPIVADMETLDIDISDGETISDKKMIVTKVSVGLEDSRGMFIGPRPPENDAVDPLKGLNEAKIRNLEDYDDPVRLVTGDIQVNIRPEWNSNGRVFLRHVDPLPLAVLSIAPAIAAPIPRKRERD